MASELHVDAIKHSGGTSAMTIDSSGNVQIPGHVVQTVEFTDSTNYTTTSTNTYVQGPQTSSFTLKNSSNKVLVTATFLGSTTLSSNYSGGRFALYRGGISGGTKITEGSEPQVLAYSNDLWVWICLQKLDCSVCAIIIKPHIFNSPHSGILCNN